MLLIYGRLKDTIDKMFSYFVYVLVVTFVSIVSSDDPYARCPSSVARTSHLFTYKDVCIELNHDENEWDNARRHCKRNGGDLVVIRDQEKQSFIVSALKRTRWDRNGIWIGATDRDREGQWRWVTGERITTYSYWGIDEGPRRSGFLFSSARWEDCALIRVLNNYKWEDYPCSGVFYHYSSICEYDMLPAPKTQASTSTIVSTTLRPTTTVQALPTSTIPPTTTKSPVPSTTQTTARTTQTVEPSTERTAHTTTIIPSPTTKITSPTTLVPTTKRPTKIPSTLPTSRTTATPTTKTSTPTTTNATPSPTTRITLTTKRKTSQTRTAAPTTTRATLSPTTQTHAPQTTIKHVPTTKITASPTTPTPPPTRKMTTTHKTATSPITKQASTSATTVQPDTPSPRTTKPAPHVSTMKPATTSVKTSRMLTTRPKTQPASKVVSVKPRIASSLQVTNSASKISITKSMVTNKKPTANSLGGSHEGHPSKGKSYTGYIIGAVVTAVVAGCVLVAIIVIRRRRASNRTSTSLENPTYSAMYGQNPADLAETDPVFDASNLKLHFGESMS